VKAIQAPYAGQLAPGTGDRALSRRFVDDSKVTDHHAILPTSTRPEGVDLFARRAQDLRPRLPPAAHGLATRITSGL